MKPGADKGSGGGLLHRLAERALGTAQPLRPRRAGSDPETAPRSEALEESEPRPAEAHDASPTAQPARTPVRSRPDEPARVAPLLASPRQTNAPDRRPASRRQHDAASPAERIAATPAHAHDERARPVAASAKTDANLPSDRDAPTAASQATLDPRVLREAVDQALQEAMQLMPEQPTPAPATRPAAAPLSATRAAMPAQRQTRNAPTEVLVSIGRVEFTAAPASAAAAREPKRRNAPAIALSDYLATPRGAHR